MDLRHKHWAIIAVGTLIGIFLILILFYVVTYKKAIAPITDVATSTPVTAVSTTSAPTAHIIENATYYDIDLTYPSATPLLSVSADANAKAVAAMKAEMQSIADEFKKNGDFENLSHDDVQIMRLDERKEAVGSKYETYTGNRTVSYVFEVYEDTLGAHPNAYYRTFTFDTTTGAHLSLRDIFSTNDYLSALSKIARDKLPSIIAKRSEASVSEIDTDYIQEGTTPEEGTFENWYLSGKNLVVVFPPYQVGPYALGPVELPIPISSLSSSLNTSYK